MKVTLALKRKRGLSLPVGYLILILQSAQSAGAHAAFSPETQPEWGFVRVEAISIDQGFRRRGLATQLFGLAVQHLRTLLPPDTQCYGLPSDLGEKFWPTLGFRLVPGHEEQIILARLDEIRLP